MTAKVKEYACGACMGTGYPAVVQPLQPDRRIYPAKCEACDGKGKIRDAT